MSAEGSYAAGNASPAALVELRGVGRRFRRGEATIVAVDGVDLAVRPGESLGLIGPSGAGKTTLARLLVGHDEPDAGEVLLRGRPRRSLSRRLWRAERRKLQLVFQDAGGALNPRLRVGEALAEAVRFGQGSDAGEARRRVPELLEQVEVYPEVAASFPSELSSGQRQRVSLARALATQPDLLVADEPVSALDASVRAQILHLLHRIHRDSDLALVLIAHDLQTVRSLTTRTCVLVAGRVVEEGGTARVTSEPRHPVTRRMVELASARLELGPLTEELPPNLGGRIT